MEEEVTEVANDSDEAKSEGIMRLSWVRASCVYLGHWFILRNQRMCNMDDGIAMLQAGNVEIGNFRL
ncbi:hypothetical protein Tco_0952516 [Tanacetum coccineum]|uniref:Uncharacterized protein n=1 Tax=Tanacetum coccineum TaxID=301880 RepID=A0ABQ5E030_9ASTR